jgi:putative MATE family efflux protein
MPPDAPIAVSGSPALDARTHRLLNAAVLPTLLRLAVPNVLVMLAQTSVGLIETYFIAKLGIDALAGVSLAFPVLMLMQMVSGGAMGGGIITAVARMLGQGQSRQAADFAWYAVLIALICGLLTTVIALTAGPAVYRLMGGQGESLHLALSYSNTIFGGALLIWIFNSLAAVIRGTGQMILPTVVICAGAAMLIPLSPALIFGWGPLPHLGVTGGAAAVLVYYAVGSAVFVWYLWGGKGVLRPTAVPARLRWQPLGEILRVGSLSSVASFSTNLTIAGVTSFVATHGTAAVAGYGAGSRLEYLLVPLVFGLGVPISVMVGTSIGAGNQRRALTIAWRGAALACGMTEIIGLAAAIWPRRWLGAFADDPRMLAAGVSYLQAVGPWFGLFGLGMGLYFAAQGAGRMGLPACAAVLRTVVALGGCWLAVRYNAGIDVLFLAVAAGMGVMAAINVGATVYGIGYRRRD